jgi:hypothetical protein
MNLHAHQRAKQAILLSGKAALVREASLGPGASLFVSASVVAHTLWASAAMGYRLHRALQPRHTRARERNATVYVPSLPPGAGLRRFQPLRSKAAATKETTT